MIGVEHVTFEHGKVREATFVTVNGSPIVGYLDPAEAEQHAREITWTLVGTVGGFEYWQLAGDIYRRRETSHNWHGVDGTPSGVRWEGSRAWFDQWIAPSMASNPETCGTL